VHTDPESPSLHNSISSDLPLSTPSTSPNRTHPSTPCSSTIPLTIEERLAQLQHSLSQINTERETLAASLKSARRDSQKADAALRSEIDVLKRASEKHAAAEHRAKQKILSLQEAVKRAQTATRETEEVITEVQGVLPNLNKKRAEKDEVYNKVKNEADRARKERDLEAEKEKKKLESMKNELTTLSNKLEKLYGKKEKLETGIIADLEEQLKEVEHEMERAEMDSYVDIYAPATDQQELTADLSAALDPKLDHSHSLPYLPTERMRHQTTPAGTIGRPSPTPIQRPPPSETPFGHQSQLWTHHTSPRQSQTTHQTHNQRSSSLHYQTPILLTNPQRRKSITTPPQLQIQTSKASPPVSQLAAATVAPASTSTLSSRAPAFEPGRPLKTANVSTTSMGLGASSVPIQRPGAARGVPVVMGVHSKANPASQLVAVPDGSRIG